MEGLEVIDPCDPASALKLGTALHKGIETDAETAIAEYFMSYPVIDERHVDEAIKLEYWIPKVKEMIPADTLHEQEIRTDYFLGYIDALVPCTKLDANLPDGRFDLIDFKYSNSDRYKDSGQLSVYKYFLEKTTGKRIRDMYFMLIPKTQIKKKKEESEESYRKRIYEDMQSKEIKLLKMDYEPDKVAAFLETCIRIQNAETFKKEPSYLCGWCKYKKFCEKGDETMILPKAERREINPDKQRKIWIYGNSFSGKTTFVDSAPNPLNLNTDGNIKFVTMPYVPIKDTMDGRIRVMAWENFLNTLSELEKTAGQNGFDTIVVDLLEDLYQSCRLYMYKKTGIEHESDDNFRAWDKLDNEFLPAMRRFFALDYKNLVIISKEDDTKDIMKKSGDKITAIKPAIRPKIADKLAGMVDIVGRVVAEEDGTRTLNFKSNEVIFGGGRLTNLKKEQIPLKWESLMEVYDECVGIKHDSAPVSAAESKVQDEPKQTRTRTRSRTRKEPEAEQEEPPKAEEVMYKPMTVEPVAVASAEPVAEPISTDETQFDVATHAPAEEVKEEPKQRTRRTRKARE
jgi:phage nucleotide-binding protein